jgi:hypothetical protein
MMLGSVQLRVSSFARFLDLTGLSAIAGSLETP